MDIARFKRVLATFADSSTDIELSKGRVVVQVHGELIDAVLQVENGEVIVDQEGIRFPGEQWLIQVVAKLPLLADRILSYAPSEKLFVTPNGSVLEDIASSPNEQRKIIKDSVSETLRLLDRRFAGTTKVVYLTSDAGEGKTTLINEMARRQATSYKARSTSWLLLPVSLMGRTFLRFDDVMIGALMNKYRFSMLYYESLIELVRLGAIVPALDGFEEVFVESEGEALSAVGSLMNSLQSEGALLIATRKAFYEIKNFSSQAKLFDSIGSYDVDFCHISLHRWNDQQFVEYATKVGFASPIELYQSLSKELGEVHALLTRAFLVKSLLSYLSGEAQLTNAIAKVTAKTDSMLYTFVNSMIEREVTKWLDKSGEPLQPLLSASEHHELLSSVADEMWVQSTDSLSATMLEGIAEIFCESKQYSASKTRQIRERIKQHALLVPSASGADQYSFDHEEFKNFFFGEAIGSYLKARNAPGLKSTLRRTALPQQTLDTIVWYLSEKDIDRHSIIEFVTELSRNEFTSSYVKENAGGIVLRVLHASDVGDVELSELLFPQGSLSGRDLKKIKFISSVFQSTDLEGTSLTEVEFNSCQFDTLDFSERPSLKDVSMHECEIKALILSSKSYVIYSPEEISQQLSTLGIVFQAGYVKTPEKPYPEPDIELQVIERIFRAFTRATALNENVIRLKAGSQATVFFDDILPKLIKGDVIEQVTYVGSGRQRRYRLRLKMFEFTDAMARCKGNFNEFLKLITPKVKDVKHSFEV